MTLYYCDVSEFQSGLSLKGAHAVCARVSEGNWKTDAGYAEFRAQAAKIGALFFCYHFLEQGSSPASQAAHCYSIAGKTPLMLDFESIPGESTPGITQAESFIDEFRKLGGICHLLYLPNWYWNALGSPSLAPFARRKMSLVSSAYTPYTDADPGTGWQPYGGMTPAIWQYTDTLWFNGQKIDFNAFRGTHPGDQSPSAVTASIMELSNLIHTGIVNPSPVPAPPPLPPPPPPVKPHAYRQVADGKQTLDEVAARRGTTAAHIVAVSKQNLNTKNAAELDQYLAHKMPRGLVYWTTNP